MQGGDLLEKLAAIEARERVVCGTHNADAICISPDDGITLNDLRQIVLALTDYEPCREAHFRSIAQVNALESQVRSLEMEIAALKKRRGLWARIRSILTA